MLQYRIFLKMLTYYLLWSDPLLGKMWKEKLFQSACRELVRLISLDVGHSGSRKKNYIETATFFANGLT